MDLSTRIMPDVLVDADLVIVRDPSWRNKLARWTKDRIAPSFSIDPDFLVWVDESWMDWKRGYDTGMILYSVDWTFRLTAHAEVWFELQKEAVIFRSSAVYPFKTRYEVHEWMKKNAVQRAYTAREDTISMLHDMSIAPWRNSSSYANVEDLITMQRRTRRKKY